MEPTTSRPRRPEPSPDPRALAALIACEADLAAVERGLVLLAAHPVTGGADRAALVRHDVLLEVPAPTSSREFTIRKGARRK